MWLQLDDERWVNLNHVLRVVFRLETGSADLYVLPDLDRVTLANYWADKQLDKAVEDSGWVRMPDPQEYLNLNAPSRVETVTVGNGQQMVFLWGGHEVHHLHDPRAIDLVVAGLRELATRPAEPPRAAD